MQLVMQTGPCPQGQAMPLRLCFVIFWRVSSVINLKSVAEISFAQLYEAAYTLPQVVYGG